MQAESLLINIPVQSIPTSEDIEAELIKRNIIPLRWAVVYVSDNIYTVSVTNLKEKE